MVLSRRLQTRNPRKRTSEQTYHHIGLVDIVSTLQQRVQIKDEIEAKCAEANMTTTQR